MEPAQGRGVLPNGLSYLVKRPTSKDSGERRWNKIVQNYPKKGRKSYMTLSSLLVTFHEIPAISLGMRSPDGRVCLCECVRVCV